MKLIRELGSIKKPPAFKPLKYAIYECECGKETEAIMSSVKRGTVTRCYECGRKSASNKMIKHGDSSHPLYKQWLTMRQRCYNKKCKAYADYGARGITIKWDSYEDYKQWAIDSGYKSGLTIERRDNNGDYEPSNCKWIPISEQPHNRRCSISNRLSDSKIESIKKEYESGSIYKDLATKYNVSMSSIRRIIKG